MTRSRAKMRARRLNTDDSDLETGVQRLPSRGSSLRRSVSGLVRRVSQKVSRDNKGNIKGFFCTVCKVQGVSKNASHGDV